MYNKKGALELSINTIVIVVIGITILSLGLIFVKNMFGSLEKTQKGVFEGAEKEIGKIGGEEGKGLLVAPSQIEIGVNDQKAIVVKQCAVEGVDLTALYNAAIGVTTTGQPAGSTITVDGTTFTGTKYFPGGKDSYSNILDPITDQIIGNDQCKVYSIIVTTGNTAPTSWYLTITPYAKDKTGAAPSWGQWNTKVAGHPVDTKVISIKAA